VHHRRDSRPQLFDCLQYRVVEVAQPLPLQSSVQVNADVSAGQPKVDVISLVDHRILGAFQLAIGQRNQRKADSDHREDDADGAKYDLGWYDVRDPSRDIQGLNSGIQ